MYTTQVNPPGGINERRTVFLVCLAVFFVFSAGFLSDFAVPWDDTEILYEITMIAGLVLSALFINRYRDRAFSFVKGGALLTLAASLYIQCRGLSLWPFLMVRLGMTPLFTYMFWMASIAVRRFHCHIILTFSVLVSHVMIAFFLYTQVILKYYGAIGAFFCLCGTLSLFFAKDLVMGRDGTSPLSAGQPMYSKPDVTPKFMILLILLILMLSQLFNSLDVILLKQISQSAASGSNDLIHPFLILLIGIGYFLSGLIVQKTGIPRLFLISCAIVQIFLVIALVPHEFSLTHSVLPLYVIGSAGMDFCIILSPRLFGKPPPSPMQCILGFVVFRFLKLNFIPSLLPDSWMTVPLERLLVVLAILFALGLMIVVFSFLIRHQSISKTGSAEKTVTTKPPQSPPPLPENLTPREREVLRHLLAGKDRTAISVLMGISFSTVNKHCVSIYRKTGCSSHVELLVKYGTPHVTPDPDEESGS